MDTDVKIIKVAYNIAGQPDKKGIGRQLITWFQQGYRLVDRDEIIGECKAQNYTMLTFSKDA